jgi:hypothetical protein
VLPWRFKSGFARNCTYMNHSAMQALAHRGCAHSMHDADEHTCAGIGMMSSLPLLVSQLNEQ